jgi:hypothetical protein
MTVNQALLTRKELQDAIGVTKGGLDLWQLQGLPVHRLPQRIVIRGQRATVLFDLAEVNAWRVNRDGPKRELKSERRTLDQEIYEIVEEQQPMTVRQVYYLAVVAHLVEKTEAGYQKIKNVLIKMREATIADENGDKFDDETPRLPLDWLVDNGRVVYDRVSFSTPAAAIANARDIYNKAFWDERDERVYIWVEKDALASVIYQETHPYDVPLMVARGVNSISFIFRVAEMISRLRPQCLHLVSRFVRREQE